MGIKRWLDKIGVTGVFWGRSLGGVPYGSLVLFPYQPATLNCGITGLLAFKAPPSKQDPGDLVAELEGVVNTIAERFSQRLAQGEEDLESPSGETDALLARLAALGDRGKDPALFRRLFTHREYQVRLAALCTALDGIIGDAQQALAEAKEWLTWKRAQDFWVQTERLKDVYWTLKHDTLANIDKIKDLVHPADLAPGDIPGHAVDLLREINLVFNNLDRLEVRGRDSAGISVLSVLDKEVFSRFRQALADEDRLQELERRANDPVLVNGSIRINDDCAAGVSVAFVFKVAAEIGRLGDNVAFLREQVRKDAIFSRLLTLPRVHHSVLAHTRWASVGEISEPNCHPVENDTPQRGIIHACLNGDIDNYHHLSRAYETETGKTIDPSISTDTKIIPLRIEQKLENTESLAEAFRQTVSEFDGSHAIAMHTDLAPGKVFLAQRGSGQAVFTGLAGSCYVPASEIYGFVEQAGRFVKLDGEKTVDGVSGETQGQMMILDAHGTGGVGEITAMYYDGTPIVLSEADVKEAEIRSRDIDRQDYPHYFLKEISESPRSVEQTIQGRLSIQEENGEPRPRILLDGSVIPDRLAEALKNHRISRIFFIGQGTAGVAASGCTTLLRDYLQQTAIRVAAFKASEFSGFMMDGSLADTLVVAISQSGTTTDTNRAIDMAKRLGAYTLAIVNRRDSDVTFKVDGVLYTSTGRDIEMSVASTKAYYSQIVAGGILGLRIAQLTGARSDDFVLGEMQKLWKLSSAMRKVLHSKAQIRRSAERFAVTRRYWAIVGSGPNKVSADEIRIKLSELCYKSISSDVVEDKKHIDLSSEPLILVCAAGNRESVVTDIVKDTAIFKAHEAVPIVITTEGEHRFEPYADSVIYVPPIEERFAPILNTLAGHLWGYYAALAINEESQYLYTFREEMNRYIETCTDRGLDIYEIVLDKGFRERATGFYSNFKKRIGQDRYATAMALQAGSDLTLLLKYLSGRLPIKDFEFDFGQEGTAPNLMKRFFSCIGKVINEMARPVDAIKHQAKTVTVGTSRIPDKVEGFLFEALEGRGFSKDQLTTSNILVLKRLQEVVAEIKGVTTYGIENLNILGEPTEDSAIHLINKEGTSAELSSRIEQDKRLHGTKRIIVKNGNVFIGRGKRDNRSILVVPVISSGTKIDHLVLFEIGFQRGLALHKKVDALGGKYHHIRNLVEEMNLAWQDQYLDRIGIEDLFGMSAEKISERIVSEVRA